MKIFVKSMLGNHWELANLDGPTTQGRHLKHLVQFQTGIPQHTQRLLYKGCILEDGSTLASCGVRDGCTLQLVLQLSTGL